MLKCQHGMLVSVDEVIAILQSKQYSISHVMQL